MSDNIYDMLKCHIAMLADTGVRIPFWVFITGILKIAFSDISYIYRKYVAYVSPLFSIEHV